MFSKCLLTSGHVSKLNNLQVQISYAGSNSYFLINHSIWVNK